MKTVKTLEKSGYTGKWYIICDNEDKTIDTYYKNFGKERIIVFDKLEAARITDSMDNIDKRNTIVYARNMCHKIAKDLGLTYFWELEDDYEIFRSRVFNGEYLASIIAKDLNSLIDEMLEFLDLSGALSIAFCQTGDFIGGTGSKIYKERITRKAMNTLFCRTDRPFKFLGRMNDDVNAYTLLGSQGKLFFTIADISLEQTTTQVNSGGNTDMYKEFGTYVKSFYSVMCSPSSVKIAEMGCNDRRIHHLVNWEVAVPKIISDRFRVKE